MCLEDRVQVIENKIHNKEEPRCLFCSDYDEFWTDIVKEAYQRKINQRISKQDPKTCIHNNDPWLLDSIKIAGFMKTCFKTNSRDKAEGFAMFDINSMEDVRNILLDDTKRRFLFMRFRLQMFHYCSWMDIYDEWSERKRKGLPTNFGKIEEESERRDKQCQKDAVNHYNKAEECVTLTKDFIKNHDLSDYTMLQIEIDKYTGSDKNFRKSELEKKIKEAESVLGISFEYEEIQ